MVNTLLGLTYGELTDIMASLGEPKYRARQLVKWLYVNRVSDINEMSDLPQSLRRALVDKGYVVGRSAPIDVRRSKDGTVKYLFALVDGGFVETVYIPDNDRATVCVSCQNGCKMNCMFCHTGKQGFNGHLRVVDIINQVMSVENADKVTNVVFMGQGEPFDNLDNVMQALEVMTSEWGFAWSPKRITVSTVGLKKSLRRFLDESQCHLAVSLHAPSHELRLRFMPAEKQFPVEDIVALLREYDFSHQRRLTFEYIMFKGVNDGEVHAKMLLKLLNGMDCRINLIRFHSVPGIELEGCEKDKMLQFRDYLTSHGLYTTIRASRGEDIWAACGLLSTAHKEASENN